MANNSSKPDLANHVRIYTGRLFYDGSYTDEQRWVKAEFFEALRARLAAETNGVDPDYKLPCEVRLPPAMSIGKGVPLRTLLTALRHREQWSDPQDLVFQDERAMAMRRALNALTAIRPPVEGVLTISTDTEHCTVVESSEKSGEKP